MQKVSRLIQKIATGKRISILFVLTMSVYITMLAYSIPIVAAYSPELPIFDLSPTGYSFSYAYDLLETLGVEGRILYVSVQLPLDLIYPGLFAITYSLLLVWIFGKTFNVESKIYYFAFVPLCAGLFDYIENIFIMKMIDEFPNLQETTVNIASTFTILKSSFTVFFFILLIVGIVLMIKAKLFKKVNNN